MRHSQSKSVVLEKTKHLLELKYSGRTPDNYLHHISLFLNHAKNVPSRVNNEDILNYNIYIKNKGHSYRNVAINAIKAYFNLYLRKKVKGFSSIRPPKQFKPKKYLFNGQKSLQYKSINAVCQNYLGIRFHSLRASGSTHAVIMGADIKTVSEMLGHKSVETTKFYIPTIFKNVKQVC